MEEDEKITITPHTFTAAFLVLAWSFTSSFSFLSLPPHPSSISNQFREN